MFGAFLWLTAKANRGRFLNLLNAMLRNTCLFTSQITQVIQLSATNFTVLVDSDAFNERTVHGEDTLNADVAGHLTNRETLLVLVSVNSNHVAAELLNTLLVTLFNTISHSDLVTGCEWCVICFFVCWSRH